MASQAGSGSGDSGVNCAKCDRPVLGANRRKRMPEAHAVCPKRKGHRKRKRPPKKGRLRGRAWELRKGEVFLRDGGCVAPMIRVWTVLATLGVYEPPWTTGPCAGPLDVDHIVKRSKGGTDELDNLRVLCRRHHNKRHPEKRVRWSGSAA